MFELRSPLSDRISAGRARAFIGLSLFTVIVFWDTEFVFPVKVFTVFLHEISHAFAALLTGGRVLGISIDPSEGGSTTTAGGDLFWILTAGYLGSILWGGLILLLASRTDLDRAVTLIVSSVLGIMTFFFVENDYGANFGYLASAFGIIAALKLPEIFCEAILIHVGTTSCIYAVIDIIDDLFDPNSFAANDAVLLADLTAMPEAFWAVIWLLASISSTVFFLRCSLFGFRSAESEDEDEDWEQEEDYEEDDELDEAVGS